MLFWLLSFSSCCFFGAVSAERKALEMKICHVVSAAGFELHPEGEFPAPSIPCLLKICSGLSTGTVWDRNLIFWGGEFLAKCSWSG